MFFSFISRDSFFILAKFCSLNDAICALPSYLKMIFFFSFFLLVKTFVKLCYIKKDTKGFVRCSPQMLVGTNIIHPDDLFFGLSKVFSVPYSGL